MKSEAKVKNAKRRMEEYEEKQKKARGSHDFQEGAPGPDFDKIFEVPEII